MRTVELTTGELAIPIITKTYLTKSRLIAILSNVLFYGDIDLKKCSKTEVMKEVRRHVWWQGVTTYSDWYEDTDDIPIINKFYDEAEKFINIVFPELK